MSKSIIIINNLMVKNELLFHIYNIYRYDDTTSSVFFSDCDNESIFSISFNIKTRPLHRSKNSLNG